jgi:quercetin dioxygenase-like cupin family protein
MLRQVAGAVALIALVSSLSPSQAADEKPQKADSNAKDSSKASDKSKAADNAKGSPSGWSADKSRVTLVYDHALPNVPGKSIKGVLVEYKPGGSSPGHTHPKSAFIYATVLEGAIRSQVNKGPIKTYKAGESFSEMPGDVHGVSANASITKPARLLAVFVVDSNEKELTTNLK